MQDNGATYKIKAHTVDIIVPVYNAAPYLRESIDSLLNQTFSDFRIILINDGSTDNSLEIIQSYDDPRIEIINMPENGGIVKALNAGLSAATAKYIARFDADDICFNNRLEKQVMFLENNDDIGVLGGQVELFGDAAYIYEEIPTKHDEIISQLLFKNVIPHPTVMIRKSVLDETGLQYSSDHPHLEDYDLWLKLASNTRFHNLPDILIRYRMMGQNITSKNRDTYRERLAHLHKTYLSKQGLSLDGDELTLYAYGFEYGFVDISKVTLNKLFDLHNKIASRYKQFGIENNGGLKVYLRNRWKRNFIPINRRGQIKHVFHYWRVGGVMTFSQIKTFVKRIFGVK